MRIGAIFARGSCRALKWMVVLGALSVLGSAQATAQTVEEARYSATGRNVTVTMSSEVWVDLVGVGENAQNLSDDFALVGAGQTITDAQAVKPIAVDGIPSDRFPGRTTFTLRFDRVVADLAFTDTDGNALQMMLVYPTAVTTRPIKGTVSDRPIEAVNVPVIGPEQHSVLTLDFEPGQKTALEAPRMRGKMLAMDPEVGELPALVLPTATGPIGTELTYSVLNLPPGLATTTGGTQIGEVTAVATAPATIYGPLPNYIGTWDVIYTVTYTDGPTERLTFKINVADTPEAVTKLEVFPAGPSSLKVTWDAGDTNNATITSYDLEYRAAGATTDFLPALLPLSVVASKSYTIEGLAPGDYEVRVRATNILGDSIWAEAKGSTGAGPGKVTLTLTVDSTIPEDRDQIPVTVKATVPPSAAPSRTLTVTLTLEAGTKVAEDRAELPNTAGIDPDVTWDSPHATVPARRTPLMLAFNSNLSSEVMVYLNTAGDVDAEDETFRIKATSEEHPGVFDAINPPVRETVVIDDDEVQEYKLELSVALESSKEFKEGNGDDPVNMTLVVSPPRTLPKSFFVNLESAQDASDYSLTSGGTSSGGPTAVSLRIDMEAGGSREDITLTAASNDGDRVDDTITLRMFETAAASPTTAGDMVGDDVMLKVVDQHKLPTVTMDSIMVDGAEVTSLMEGETGTVMLMADRGTATDATPDGEKITVALTHGAASSASAADYSLSSETVTITGTSGTFMLEVLADDEIDAEELVLQAAVTGVAMYGDAADMVDLGPISFMDGTMKLVYPKTDEEIQAVIYPAKEAGMGDDMMFNPGEMIEIASPGSLFNSAEGVTLSYTAMSDMEDVATVAVSGGGMVTVTAQDMAGVMAHITITAHASMAAAGAKGLPQTDPSEASIIFPVEVGLEALSFTLSGPEDMNLAEGMSAMVTATASRAVTADTTVTLMRDRAASTAGNDDYTAGDITIEAGMMMGTTMVMAVADDMAEEMEELVLYGMAADNAGEVTGQVKLYIWDAAVPALPLIAQLLLGLLLGMGGYRRYLRR